MFSSMKSIRNRRVIPISGGFRDRTTALPPEAAIELELVGRAAYDPFRTFRISLQQTDFEPNLVRFPPILGLREPRCR